MEDALETSRQGAEFSDIDPSKHPRKLNLGTMRLRWKLVGDRRYDLASIPLEGRARYLWTVMPFPLSMASDSVPSSIETEHLSHAHHSYCGQFGLR